MLAFDRFAVEVRKTKGNDRRKTRFRVLLSPPTKKELLFIKSSFFVYPSRRLGISSPHNVRCISSRAHCALVSHHASACILLRLDDIQRQAVDNIPQQVADDIHAYGVIGTVVLYATKGKIKKVGQVKVNSLIIRGSTPHSNSDNSIPQKSGLSTDSSKKDLTDTKFDLADNDTAYMSAVESGDMEAAQRMVDEAAKEAGY